MQKAEPAASAPAAGYAAAVAGSAGSAKTTPLVLEVSATSRASSIELVIGRHGSCGAGLGPNDLSSGSLRLKCLPMANP